MNFCCFRRQMASPITSLLNFVVLQLYKYCSYKHIEERASVSDTPLVAWMTEERHSLEYTGVQ